MSLSCPYHYLACFHLSQVNCTLKILNEKFHNDEQFCNFKLYTIPRSMMKSHAVLHCNSPSVQYVYPGCATCLKQQSKVLGRLSCSGDACIQVTCHGS